MIRPETGLSEFGNDFSPVYRQAIDQLQELRLSPLQAAGYIDGQVVNQSYLLSSLEPF